MRILFSSLAFAGLLTAAVPSVALEMSPLPAQGMMVRGKVEPGAKVALDGHALQVSPDGQFIMGFSRDAKRQATLVVTQANGKVEKHPLDVTPRAWDIQRIDGLPEKQVTPDPAALEKIKAERPLLDAAHNVVSTQPDIFQSFIWPAEGPISGIYGSQRILNGQPRAFHTGLDIAGNKGSPIIAPTGGVVTLAQPDLYFTGGTVIIDHGFGVHSVMCHMSRIDVKVGDHLTQGQQVGLIGATGRVTGPHLHWGLYWYHTVLDPEPLVQPSRRLKVSQAPN